MIYPPQVTVNCDVTLCHEALEVRLNNPGNWVYEVSDYMQEAEWSEEPDGHYCPRHKTEVR